MSDVASVLNILFYVFCFLFLVIKAFSGNNKSESLELLGFIVLGSAIIFRFVSCTMNSSMNNDYYIVKEGDYIVKEGQTGRGPKSRTGGPHYGIRDAELAQRGWQRGENGKIRVTVGEKTQEFTSAGDAKRWETNERKRQSGEKWKQEREQYIKTRKVDNPDSQEKWDKAQAEVDSFFQDGVVSKTKIDETFRNQHEIALVKAKDSEFIVLSGFDGSVSVALHEGKPIKLGTPEADEFMRKYPDAHYENQDVAAQAEKVRSTPTPVEPTESKPEEKKEETGGGTFNPTEGVPGTEERPNQTTNSTSEVIAPTFRPGTRAEKELELIQKSDLSNEATDRMLGDRLRQLWEDKKITGGEFGSLSGYLGMKSKEVRTKNGVVFKTDGRGTTNKVMLEKQQLASQGYRAALEDPNLSQEVRKEIEQLLAKSDASVERWKTLPERERLQRVIQSYEDELQYGNFTREGRKNIRLQLEEARKRLKVLENPEQPKEALPEIPPPEVDAPPTDVNLPGDASFGSPFSVSAVVSDLRERLGLPKVEDVRRHLLPGSAQGSLNIGVPEWWRRLVAAANPAQNPTPTVDLLRELRSTTSLTRYNEILNELDARGVNPEGRFFPKRWSYADVEEAKAERKKHLKIDRELQTTSEPDYKPLFGIDVVAPLRKALAKRNMRKNITVDDAGKMQVTLTQRQAEDVFGLSSGTELTSKPGMQVSHNGDTYTITFDRGITQNPLGTEYKSLSKAGGTSLVDNLTRRYQELEKERNVAEILGDTERVKALESDMERILPSKVDANGIAIDPAPIPEHVRTFQAVSPLLNLEGRLLENFNNSFGIEIKEQQFNDLLRLFTPEELAAKGIRLRRTIPLVQTQAGPVTAPETKFIIEPLRIRPDGTPVFDQAAPSFANNPRMKRDAEGNLFVDARDINNREGFFEGGENAVLENRENNGFYRVNNPQAQIGANVETPKAKGGPGVSSPGGSGSQGINVTVRNGRGIGCLVPASIVIGAGGLCTAGLIHHTAKPYDEKKEEYVKTNAQPSEEVVTEAAGMMLDELGLPHTDEYMDTARARVIQNYEQTWAEYYDDNHIFDKPFGYMASGIENGVPEVASDAYDSTMRGLGLRRRDEPKQKLNYERKDYVSAVLNKRRSVKKEEKKAPEPEPSKDVPKPWSLDKSLQNARNWEMAHLRLPKAVEPVSHTLTGAGIGAAAGGTIGALRYLFGNTAQLSAEEKKRRKLMKMILSNAGIGAGLGATVGGIADVRHSFIEPPEIKSR